MCSQCQYTLEFEDLAHKKECKKFSHFHINYMLTYFEYTGLNKTYFVVKKQKKLGEGNSTAVD